MSQNGSILDETKKALGLDDGYDVFDTELVIFINGVFSTLNQLGVGPEDGYEIASSAETWADFTGGDPKFNSVKTLVYIRTKLLFDIKDEGMTSYVIQAFERQADQIEWRLNMEIEQRLALARQSPEEDLIWLIDGSEDFPAEAPINAVGYDPKTGKFWRKKS